MTKVELQEELKKQGVELTGEETVAHLKSMLGDVTGKAPAVKGAAYVWLKIRSYIDLDGKERVDAGFYEVKSLAKYPRLKNQPAKVCEIFEGEVPARKLADIARWCGVNPDEHRDDDKLLDLLAKEPKVLL